MKNLVVVRGGGELATGTIHCLFNAGFRVLILENRAPSTLRREVAFAEAAYDGEKTVEHVTCRRASDYKAAERIMKKGEVALLIDPGAQSLGYFRPKVLIDGTHKSHDNPTTINMAELTIGLGTGFCAGSDVDCVIESKRGHNLGRIIYEGYSQHDPGFMGLDDFRDRIIHAPVSGEIEPYSTISFNVHRGETIAAIHLDDGDIVNVNATVEGVLCGMLHEGFLVSKGMIIAEIDPRSSCENCFTISDKVRCIGGSVLEAIMAWRKDQPHWKNFFKF